MGKGRSLAVLALVGLTVLGTLACGPAANGRLEPDLRSEGVAYRVCFEIGTGTLRIWVRSEADDLVAVARYALGVTITGVQGPVPSPWNWGADKARAPTESDWVVLRNGQTASWTLTARDTWREALGRASSPAATFGDEPSPVPAFFAKERARVWSFPKGVPIAMVP